MSVGSKPKTTSRYTRTRTILRAFALLHRRRATIAAEAAAAGVTVVVAGRRRQQRRRRRRGSGIGATAFGLRPDAMVSFPVCRQTASDSPTSVRARISIVFVRNFRVRVQMRTYYVRTRARARTQARTHIRTHSAPTPAYRIRILEQSVHTHTDTTRAVHRQKPGLAREPSTRAPTSYARTHAVAFRCS